MTLWQENRRDSSLANTAAANHAWIGLVTHARSFLSRTSSDSDDTQTDVMGGAGEGLAGTVVTGPRAAPVGTFVPAELVA